MGAFCCCCDEANDEEILAGRKLMHESEDKIKDYTSRGYEYGTEERERTEFRTLRRGYGEGELPDPEIVSEYTSSSSDDHYDSEGDTPILHSFLPVGDASS